MTLCVIGFSLKMFNFLAILEFLFASLQFQRSTLFYHSSTQLYYMYDRATGEYNVYDKTQVELLFL